MVEDPATCKIKLIDFGVARYIGGTSNVTVMVGTPEFAGKPNTCTCTKCSLLTFT